MNDMFPTMCSPAEAAPLQAQASSHSPDSTGILPYQELVAYVRSGMIASSATISPDQIQPASIDLRLGDCAYRVRASFLPGPRATVRDRIDELDGLKIDLVGGAVLEKGCVYVIPLMEAVQLRGGLSGFANPKSSTGRLDILTRLITDRGTAFDEVRRDYAGPLYLEVAPRTFSIVVYPGSRLTQLRLRRGSSLAAESTIRNLLKANTLMSPSPSASFPRDGRVAMTIDLRGKGANSLIGYRAQKHTDRIDIEKLAHYPINEFWEPILNLRDGRIVLNPDDFYILATNERISVPQNLAAEMLAYDTTVGEFRVHYAGFFDPGFGLDPSGLMSKAVLEVRSHEVPFMLEHGQIIGWLRYERMSAAPDRLYGRDVRSNYQNQGLRLAKQFMPSDVE